MTSCTICGADLPPGAMFCGECGAATVVRAGGSTRSAAALVPAGAPDPAPVGEAASDLAPAGESVPEPEPEPEPDGEVVAAAPAGPDEHTRLPTTMRAPEIARFVLQFSTGECVTVSGSGLIGRRPAAQPGEDFETLVAIDDPSRSVSKTHLEFGQDGGSFWISDRFSANGTVVKEPERAAKLAAPGMRSRVSRGSRVEIGEQFFVVS